MHHFWRSLRFLIHGGSVDCPRVLGCGKPSCLFLVGDWSWGRGPPVVLLEEILFFLPGQRR